MGVHIFVAACLQPVHFQYAVNGHNFVDLLLGLAHSKGVVCHNHYIPKLTVCY